MQVSCEKLVDFTGRVLRQFMRMPSERAVFTVRRHNGMWAVEHDGDHFGHSPEIEVARAQAAKRMREYQDTGRACQVRIQGESGYFGVS